jgi:hypothetical protein
MEEEIPAMRASDDDGKVWQEWMITSLARIGLLVDQPNAAVGPRV